MPGLFDDVGPFLSGFGGVLGGLGRGITNAQNANTLNQAMPGLGGLMLSNPAAAQMALGQRNLQQTHDSLVGIPGPDGRPITDQAAWLLALHPEELGKLTQIQKVGPGEQLQAPFNMFGGGGAAPTSSQQPPPSSQPGPSNASVGGAGGYQGPLNTAGQINPQAIHNMVIRRLKGDTEVVSELGGGMGGGIGAINRKNFQDDLERTMKEGDPAAGVAPMTAADLVSRDAKFPAYKEATKKNADISSQMQLAQTEALGILPYLKQAALKLTPSEYPVFNAANQLWQAHTGNPASADLASYMNAMINTYSRGISSRGQGPTVNDKKHLQEVLNPAWSSGQWEAGTNAIINELGIANDAIHKNQNRIDVQYGFGKNTNPADEANARAAIAKGANRQEVIRRFEEGGFNAPKF